MLLGLLDLVSWPALHRLGRCFRASAVRILMFARFPVVRFCSWLTLRAAEASEPPLSPLGAAQRPSSLASPPAFGLAAAAAAAAADAAALAAAASCGQVYVMASGAKNAARQSCSVVSAFAAAGSASTQPVHIYPLLRLFILSFTSQIQFCFNLSCEQFTRSLPAYHKHCDSAMVRLAWCAKALSPALESSVARGAEAGAGCTRLSSKRLPSAPASPPSLSEASAASCCRASAGCCAAAEKALMLAGGDGPAAPSRPASVPDSGVVPAPAAAAAPGLPLASEPAVARPAASAVAAAPATWLHADAGLQFSGHETGTSDCIVCATGSAVL